MPMELLAPAGDQAALEAAVEAGADAVYLGGQTLNARRSAGNFDADGLLRAADYCHERGVRVHATVNILLRDSEFPQLEALAAQLARARVDAAIVQDAGAAAALREMLPDLPLHASTQMAICNSQGVRYARNAGFSRVVLARELSIEQIAETTCEGVEIEVFAHGALCVCASGLCLFSSLLGGRSGNRGLCAQPCRLAYRLEGPLVRAQGPLLSPKDLCSIHRLGELEASGVHSLKIEGRLKGADYVGLVTGLYRRALDGEPFDARALRGVFNRGYTDTYLTGLQDRVLLLDEKEKHVEALSKVPLAPRKIPLTGRLVLLPGEPARLSISDGENAVEALGETVQRARRIPIDPDRYASQIQKTGGTPYEIDELAREIAADAFLPVSALNALRRSALEALGRQRVRSFSPVVGAPRPLKPGPEGDPELIVRPAIVLAARDPRLLERARSWGADELLYECGDFTEAGLRNLPRTPFFLLLPPACTSRDLSFLHRRVLDMDERLQGVVLSNVGQLALSWPGEVRLDAAMNLMNSRSAAFYNLPWMPSLEATAREIRQMPGKRELWVYGKARLMLLRHCPLNARLSGQAHEKCRRCEAAPCLESHALIDRRGVRFALRRVRLPDGCLVEIRNSVPTLLTRRLDSLPAAARWRLTITDEDEDTAARIVRAHRRAADGQPFDPLEDIAGTGGHYFRGVE